MNYFLIYFFTDLTGQLGSTGKFQAFSALGQLFKHIHMKEDNETICQASI